MSLTSFLDDNADVRAQFRAHFTKPDFRLKSPILAPPLTECNGFLGTAFDYLLRFYAKKLNPRAKARDWVAVQGLAILCARLNRARSRQALDMMAEAKKRYEAFLESTDTSPSPALIEAATWLASFDEVFRAGIEDVQFPARPDLLESDLRKMLSLVPQEHFRAKKRCVLNPTFGAGSVLVGGADGDLIIDDTLIDIKTTKHLTFDREFFNQIIGYYVLSCIGGIDDCGKGKIKHVAIYYARYGVLHRVPLAECHKPSDLPTFLRWFKKRARA